MSIRPCPAFACFGPLLFAALPGLAAGGHFEVDDAAMLDPGRCQFEAWLVRAPRAEVTVSHLGPGCRVGPVEIGLNLDQANAAEVNSTSVGPQFKWVSEPIWGRLSAGVAWSASFNAVHGGRPAQTLYAPLTWRFADMLWVHANAGFDWAPSGSRLRRIGLSGEWAAHEAVTLIAERVILGNDWTSRLGARLNLSDAITLDLSAARVGPQANRVFAIGLSHEFAR